MALFRRLDIVYYIQYVNREKTRLRSGSRRRQAEETKWRILGAAKRLFSQYGIDRVTIEEIATEAKVASPTIFALFQSKRGLLRAFVDENLFGKRYETLVEQTKAGPPWNGLGWQRRLSGTSMMPNDPKWVFSEARPPSLPSLRNSNENWNYVDPSDRRGR
jgi:AcrR family transcriptional regulator